MDIFSLQTTKKAIFSHILSDFRTQLYAIFKLYFIKIISPLTMGLSKRWQFLPEHDFWLHEQFHDDYEWSNFLQRSMEFLILKIPWKKSINLFWIFKFFREIMFACFFYLRNLPHWLDLWNPNQIQCQIQDCCCLHSRKIGNHWNYWTYYQNRGNILSDTVLALFST